MHTPSIVSLELNCWDDFSKAQRTVYVALKRVPLLALLSFGLMIASELIDEPAELSLPLTLIALIPMTILYVRVTFESANEIGLLPLQRDKERNSYVSAFFVCLFTVLLGFIGLVLFILPGVWIIVATSLAIVFCCLNQSGPTGAIRKSMNATKGHHFTILSYLGPPAILFAVIPELASFFIAIAPDFMSKYRDSFKPFAIVSELLIALWAQWAFLALLPLQVKLYKNLQASNKQ